MEKEISLRRTVIKTHEVASTSHIKIKVEPPPATGKSKTIRSIDLEDLSVFSNPKRTDRAEEVGKDIRYFAKAFKIFSLVLIWIVCSFALMANNETVQEMHQISIPKDSVTSYEISKKPMNNQLRLFLGGALLPPDYSNMSTNWVCVWVQFMMTKRKPAHISKVKSSDIIWQQDVSDVWYVPVVTENLIGQVPEVQYSKIFKLSPHRVDNASYSFFRIQFKTNLRTNLPISMSYKLLPINPDDGVVYAALVLLGLYILIIFELTHRTLAAMLASTMSVAILAALNERPTMAEIASWVDIEALLLLFSMMVLVVIFSETGIFDHAAVHAFKLTGGKLWPLINILCLLTVLFSCFLDNVTTALLITPIIIRLCEVMRINPRQILIYTLVFANIGGAITPIGDPPNVVIANNPDVVKAGVNFGVFTLHMGAGVLVALVVVYLQIRISYRDKTYYKFDEPRAVEDLKREIAIWERTAASVGSYCKDEDAVKACLRKEVVQLQDKLKNAVAHDVSNIKEEYKSNIEDLEEQYPIKDKSLLIKSGVTLALVICVFFLHSVPILSRLGLGWTALLGALLLILLYDNQNIESILARVEWGTLIFFSSLFILMEALARLGLIHWIGKQTEYVIMSVKSESRLAAALILILWVSAIASAFVDNLPLTTMMVRIAIDLSNELQLPLQPLIWALAFGACFGGNGSLFGSSSNIVCAGVAEQHGHRFTFMQFLKIGLPVMVSSLSVITIYLIVCHVVLEWH